MANIRPFALALLGIFAVAVIAPVQAQNNAKPPKPSKQEKSAMTKQEKKERKQERKEAKRDNMMADSTNMNTGRMATGDMKNNTADVQHNIDNANKTLSDMVALLDQIEARKKGGAQ